MPADAGRKTAIVLFNLGGPDSPAAIRPFLRALFSDPAILRVPFFVRFFLARAIARARSAPAMKNYALLGGASPLLGLTTQQAAALEQALPELGAKCFIAMRYWHPLSLEAARAVKAWGAEQVVLLPLYPQYSTTTTGSSLTAWRAAAAHAGLAVPTTALCCYPVDEAYIETVVAAVRRAFENARAALPAHVPLRVLFSAHGLPENIVAAGDPYQWQIERTVAAAVAALGRDRSTPQAGGRESRPEGLVGDRSTSQAEERASHPVNETALHGTGSTQSNKTPPQPGLDWTICYQSRATPQKWIGPSTDAEIERAGHDGTAVLVVPIAFVSDHVETLVELDVEYRDLATRVGVPGYFRVPTQNADAGFVAALAGLVRRAVARGPGLCSHVGGRFCDSAHVACPIAPAGG
ncbi:MAG TPA: ferrochelatase [Acetobacteraceae bacterium]|nr:ferrochelatase [Acetobacteraceae bacterium]